MRQNPEVFARTFNKRLDDADDDGSDDDNDDHCQPTHNKYI